MRREERAETADRMLSVSTWLGGPTGWLGASLSSVSREVKHRYPYKRLPALTTYGFRFKSCQRPLCPARLPGSLSIAEFNIVGNTQSARNKHMPGDSLMSSPMPKHPPHDPGTRLTRGPQVSSRTSLPFIKEAMEYRGTFSNVREVVRGVPTAQAEIKRGWRLQSLVFLLL